MGEFLGFGLKDETFACTCVFIYVKPCLEEIRTATSKILLRKVETNVKIFYNLDTLQDTGRNDCIFS